MVLPLIDRGVAVLHRRRGVAGRRSGPRHCDLLLRGYGGWTVRRGRRGAVGVLRRRRRGAGGGARTGSAGACGPDGGPHRAAGRSRAAAVAGRRAAAARAAGAGGTADGRAGGSGAVRQVLACRRRGRLLPSGRSERWGRGTPASRRCAASRSSVRPPRWLPTVAGTGLSPVRRQIYPVRRAAGPARAQWQDQGREHRTPAARTRDPTCRPG